MKIALPFLAVLLASCAGTAQQSTPPDPRPVFAFDLVPHPNDGNAETTHLDTSTFLQLNAFLPIVDGDDDGFLAADFQSSRTNRYRNFGLNFPQESILLEGATFPLNEGDFNAYVALYESDDINHMEQKGAWALRSGTLTVTKKEDRRVTMALDAVSTETGGEATGELRLTGTVEIDFARAEQVP